MMAHRVNDFNYLCYNSYFAQVKTDSIKLLLKILLNLFLIIAEYLKTLFILFDLQVVEKNWEEGVESEAHMAPDKKVAHLL